MKKRLIVNADGFGFTSGINKGIKETIENGIVTSVSAMANMPYIEEVRMFPLKFEHVSVGIHFNIVVGKPLSPYDKVRSLINKKITIINVGDQVLRDILINLSSGSKIGV